MSVVNVGSHFTLGWPVSSFQPPWMVNRELAEAGPEHCYHSPERPGQ